jgi:serine/threonine-protein kinase
VLRDNELQRRALVSVLVVAWVGVLKQQAATIVHLPVARALDGRYRLEAQIGAGGLGVVYRATHEKLDKAVAVKLLHAHCGGDPVMRARFEREAKALAALEHPNIVLVTDYGVERDAPYLVMELLEGQTLAECLMDGAIAEQKAHELALSLLEALAYVHQSGLVHRDIKPSNVFLQRLKNGDERLKLLDFGLAKFLLPQAPEPEPGMTRSGAVLGTPAYMSPEQASGEVVDARSDVYAAGVLLIEMLSGRLPFEGDAIEQLRGHLLLDVPPLAKLNPARIAHPQLDAFFACALAKRPSERFADATSMLAALEALPRPLFTTDGAAAPARSPELDVPTAPTLAVSSQTTEKDPATTAKRSGRRSWLLALLLVALCAVIYQRRSQLPSQAHIEEAASTIAEAARNIDTSKFDLPDAPAQAPAPRAERTEAPPAPALAQNSTAGSNADAQLEAEATHDPVSQTVPGAAEVEELTPAIAAKPRAPARNPWRRPLPRELRELRTAINKNARKADQAVTRLHRYNREHPDDVRGFLLLGSLYAKRDWSTDAISQYQIAYRIDPGSRGAPEILPSALDMIVRGFATSRATRFIESVYRSDALGSVNRAIRLHHDDPRVVARLTSLQTRLQTK